MAITSVTGLAQGVVFSNIALAVITTFSLVLVLLIFVKAYCFITEMVRGTGSGLCPRTSFGVSDDPASRPSRSGNLTSSKSKKPKGLC